METKEHPLSWEALTRIVLMGILVLLLWKALGAVTDIIIAIILTVSLRPLVELLERRTRMPSLLCTFIVFIILLIPFIFIAVDLVPSLTNQLPQLAASINPILSHIPFIGRLFDNFSLTGYISAHSSNILASSGTIVLTILSVITTLILTFYFVYDYERLFKLFLNIFPYREKSKLKGFIEEISKVIGQYIRGNVIISCITFSVIFLGLLVLRVPFALPLALFAGIVDLLPLVGSTVGAIPALLVAFAISPIRGVSVLILHLIYQQVENAVISPAIYNKALNLYPSLGFLAVVIGASLFGILGAFLALPVAASIPVAVHYYETYKDKK